MDTQTLRLKLTAVPQKIRDWFGSEGVFENTKKINEHFQIAGEDRRILPRLLLRLEIQDIEPDYFAGELAEELKIDRDRALTIAAEVRRSILGPIKQDLLDAGTDISFIEQFQIPVIKKPAAPKPLEEIKKPSEEKVPPKPATTPEARKVGAASIGQKPIDISKIFGLTPFATSGRGKVDIKNKTTPSATTPAPTLLSRIKAKIGKPGSIGATAEGRKESFNAAQDKKSAATLPGPSTRLGASRPPAPAPPPGAPPPAGRVPTKLPPKAPHLVSLAKDGGFATGGSQESTTEPPVVSPSTRSGDTGVEPKKEPLGEFARMAMGADKETPVVSHVEPIRQASFDKAQDKQGEPPPTIIHKASQVKPLESASKFKLDIPVPKFSEARKGARPPQRPAILEFGGGPLKPVGAAPPSPEAMADPSTGLGASKTKVVHYTEFRTPLQKTSQEKPAARPDRIPPPQSLKTQAPSPPSGETKEITAPPIPPPPPRSATPPPPVVQPGASSELQPSRGERSQTTTPQAPPHPRPKIEPPPIRRPEPPPKA